MSLEVGIVFDYINEIHYTAMPAEMELKVDDQLIVKTIRSKEVGKIVHVRTSVQSEDPNPFLKKILRIATEKDLERELQNRTREEKAMSIAAKKIDNLKLDMTLIRVHYLFDHSRILFYFKAAGKVDFRNLVRELASVFKARIELRQIGVRDEAKMLGGIATCGRPLCCSSWLRSFAPVTVRMAKEQHLSLNPTKISGLCGRLQCCLEYEQEFYETAQKNLPSDGSQVTCSKGNGKLLKANILKSEATILLSDGTTVTVPIDEIAGQRRKKCHSSDKCDSHKTCGGCGSDAKDSRQSRRRKKPNRQRQDNKTDSRKPQPQDKKSAETTNAEKPSYENSVKVAESQAPQEQKSDKPAGEKAPVSSQEKQTESTSEKNGKKPFKTRRNRRRRKPRNQSEDKANGAAKAPQKSDATSGTAKESPKDNAGQAQKEKNISRSSRRNRRRFRDRKKSDKSGQKPDTASSDNKSNKEKSGDNS